MPTTKWITLANSNASVSKRFKALAIKMPLFRTDNIDITLGGKADKQAGTIIKQYSYILRVPIDTPDDPTFGTYAHLLSLFVLNNSQATPTDVISLTDHFGTAHSCYFVGEMSPEPLTTMLEGPNAWHLVQVTLQEIT